MEQYILFSSNNQNFAISISNIEKIIEYQEPRKVPDSSDFFLGVVTYNNRILPIIHLSKRLYKVSSMNNVDRKVIVIWWKEQLIGLLVDNIIGIQAFDENLYEESKIDLQVSQKYIKGFIKIEDDIIVVLDIDNIFCPDEEKELLQAVDIAEN